VSLLGASVALAARLNAQPLPGSVGVIRVEGIINPATDAYLTRALHRCEGEACQALVIEMDTPGGLDTSMRAIIKTMLATPMPVIVYVSPSTARAASAGTLITLAADVAAMAPSTSIGAATPIDMSGGDLARKIVNDAISYARGVARSHKRNEDWAEEAVRKGASITEKEALRLKVIDLVAPSLNDLLAAVDGRTFVKNGRTTTLHTKAVALDRIERVWREQFIQYLAEPNILALLMTVAVIGIITEISTPGVILPGVIGVIAAILAFISAQILPINLGAFLLVLLGVGLLVADIKLPSHGALTAGGATSFILGMAMLTGWQRTPGFAVDWSVVTTVAVLVVGFFVFIVSKGLLAQRRKVVTGMEGLRNMVGEARTRLEPRGTIFVNGELWQAIADTPIDAGERVVVVGADKFTLQVRRVTQSQ